MFMVTLKQKVVLKDVRFHAFHGFYEEERLLGGEFFVTIETEADVYDDGNDNLNNTVNYERLFEITSQEMSKTKKLIETVAHSILDRVRHEFLAVKAIKVCLRKSNLPLSGEVSCSIIELSFNR